MLAKRPPQAEYQRKRYALDSLKALETDGSINLFYMDKTGFTLVPPIPYTCQAGGVPLVVPSQRSKRFNGLGFMTRQNQMESYVSAQTITGDFLT